MIYVKRSYIDTYMICNEWFSKPYNNQVLLFCEEWSYNLPTVAQEDDSLGKFLTFNISIGITATSLCTHENNQTSVVKHAQCICCSLVLA